MNAFVSLARSGYGLSLCLCALALPFTAAAQWPASTVWAQGGHGARVNALASTTDGSLIATASDDATVKLWNTNGALLRTFSTSPYQATAVAISSDATKLAIGTYAGGYSSGSNGLGQVFLWQAASGSLATNASLLWSNSIKYGKITGLAFSSDSRLLAVGSGSGSNCIVAVSTGTAVSDLKGFTMTAGSAMVSAPAFSSIGLLASGAEDNTLTVWSSNSWTTAFITNTAQTSNITAVAFSPGGGYLASASLDQTIRVWNTTNWTCVQILTGATSGITSLAFSSDGVTVAGGTSIGVVNLWNWQTGSLLNSFVAHGDLIRTLIFLPGGVRLVSGSDDNTAKIWSVPGGTLLQQLGSYSAMVRAVAISPDGTLCASVDDTQTIQVRSTSNGRLLLTIPAQTGCVSSIAFSPDSTKLASGGGPLDPTIKIWRMTDGSLQQTISATTNGVMALAYSPDGSLIASGGDYTDQTINLWNAASGTLHMTLPGHSNGVTALAFSPNGGMLASGGRRPDYALKVWSLSDGTLLRSFTAAGHTNNIESVAFAADNDTVAAGSSGSLPIMVAHVSTGATQLYNPGTNPVFFVAFTPDGSTLAAANQDTIQLWNVATHSVVQTLNQETYQVSALTYSPNANLYLYGRGDGVLVLSTNTLGSLAQTPLVFNSVTAAPSQPASLTATVQPLTHYVIQSSPDLSAWSFLGLASSGTNSATIFDSSTNFSASRYYRAITPP